MEKKYPNTAQGAIQLLADDSDGLDLSGATAKQDPSVLGVWKVMLPKEKKSAIVFLAGYADSAGNIRTTNDFSVNESKADRVICSLLAEETSTHQKLRRMAARRGETWEEFNRKFSDIHNRT